MAWHLAPYSRAVLFCGSGLLCMHDAQCMLLLYCCLPYTCTRYAQPASCSTYSSPNYNNQNLPFYACWCMIPLSGDCHKLLEAFVWARPHLLLCT